MKRDNLFRLLILWLGALFLLSGCAGTCGYEHGARITPAFAQAGGARVYLHPPKDQALSGWMETYVGIELEHLGFKRVTEPAAAELMAYYYYSYDPVEPSYIRNFMIVFKPYPGDQSELLASASCYHRCHSSFTQAGGQEVHYAFNALRQELNRFNKTSIKDSWD